MSPRPPAAVDEGNREAAFGEMERDDVPTMPAPSTMMSVRATKPPIRSAAANLPKRASAGKCGRMRPFRPQSARARQSMTCYPNA